MVLNTITSSVLSSPFSPTTGLDLILFFFFNDTATTEIYTLSLHDALPISHRSAAGRSFGARPRDPPGDPARPRSRHRSEEHTSELQSQSNIVCRPLLEKKKFTCNLSNYHFALPHIMQLLDNLIQHDPADKV